MPCTGGAARDHPEFLVNPMHTCFILQYIVHHLFIYSVWKRVGQGGLPHVPGPKFIFITFGTRMLTRVDVFHIESRSNCHHTFGTWLKIRSSRTFSCCSRFPYIQTELFQHIPLIYRNHAAQQYSRTFRVLRQGFWRDSKWNCVDFEKVGASEFKMCIARVLCSTCCCETSRYF